MFQNKSFQLLHVGLVGNIKEFCRAGIRHNFIEQMALKVYFCMENIWSTIYLN